MRQRSEGGVKYLHSYYLIHFPDDVEDEGVGVLLETGDSGSGFKTKDGRRIYSASEAQVAQLRAAGIRYNVVEKLE